MMSLFLWYREVDIKKILMLVSFYFYVDNVVFPGGQADGD